MDLRNADCLEEMKNIDDNSIDLLFCDLPYGQTSCKWDSLIDLNLFWKQVNRICKQSTPMIFTCSTKFGNTLINSNPKNFRQDLIWIKSASVGFLNAKKRPLVKHEMVYVFYRKLPKVYTDNIALHHTHKFIKKELGCEGNVYGQRDKSTNINEYQPKLPNSIIKEDNDLCKYDINKNVYGGGKEGRIKITKKKEDHQQKYDPPLPNSIIKEDVNIVIRNDKGCNGLYGDEKGKVFIYDDKGKLRNSEARYEPPLPNSIMEIKSEKGKHSTQKPVALMEWILKYYSKENDIVLDPTMGSGSTGQACKNMNRRFIGIAKDKDIFDVAFERLID